MEQPTIYQQLSAAVGGGDSEIVPAIFETLADEREARVLLAASPPATVEELAERAGLEVEDVAEMIDPLFRKGLLFKSKKPEGTRYYRVRYLMQLHDSTAVMIDPPQEMLDLWKRHFDEEWDDYSKKMEAQLPGAALRVIPVNVTIEANSQILAFEDVKSLIDTSRNLAVTRCSCRVIDGGCGKPLEVCLQVDKAADYAIERETGRQVSKEEALRMLAQCERDGLVHVANNRRALGHVICNCCRDCCINWASLRTGLGKWASPSRFQATIIEEECIGCELCLDRCIFDAMSMSDDGDLVLVDEDDCMGCGVCQVVCPTDAITLEAVRPEAFVPA